MSTIRTLLRATAVVAGSSAALLMGGLMGTAHADPAPPRTHTQHRGAAGHFGGRRTPGAAKPCDGHRRTAGHAAAVGQRGDQNAAAVDSRLPGTASAVPGATSLLPGVPGAAPAATTATPGLGIPGLTPTLPAPAAPAPGIAGIPGLTPTVPAAAPATGPAGLLPQAQLNLPQLPFLGVPLPQQVSLPGDLTSLLTGGVPASPGISSPGLVPVPAVCAGHVAPTRCCSRCPACPDPHWPASRRRLPR